MLHFSFLPPPSITPWEISAWLDVYQSRKTTDFAMELCTVAIMSRMAAYGAQAVGRRKVSKTRANLVLLVAGAFSGFGKWRR